jgi:Sap, sulfolipid-1-addressing protein
MGEVVVLALLAALNPTLLAATTVMLLLPHPGRLMLGYWLGSMLMSVTLGLVIVFALEGAAPKSTSQNTVSPIADFVLAGILLILAGVLFAGRNKRVERRRASRKAKQGEAHKTPKWQEQLGKGSAKTTFVVGALLSLPGATYLAGLNNIHKLHYSATAVVLLVIGFNLIQLLLIELPLVALKVAPTRTPIAIEHVRAWGREHGREYAAWALVVIALALVVNGIVEAT